MELRQLRYAEAVARHRHFTRAAQELHVAQSALSHQIRRLETELGTVLFERTSRRVVPTEAGEALADRARHILALVDGVHAAVDDVRGLVRGRLAIGALLPAGEVDVPRLLARFSEAFPGVDLDLREGTAGNMIRLLEAGEIDVAFVLLASAPPPGIAQHPLSEEELVAAFPPGSTGLPAAVTARELASRAIVTPRSGSATKEALEGFFARAGEQLRVTLESGDVFLLRCLVSGGFGAAVLPGSLTGLDGPPLEVRPLEPPVRLPVALLRRDARHRSPAAEAFVRFVGERVGGQGPLG